LLLEAETGSTCSVAFCWCRTWVCWGRSTPAIDSPVVSNLAQIRGGIKSTVGNRCSKQYGVIEFTCSRGEHSLYARITSAKPLYDAMSNSCTNHQSTLSHVRFLVDSLVGSSDPQYSYSGCTCSL
jgi:hypothetical protein